MRYRIYTETGSVHEIDATAMSYVRLRAGVNSNEMRRDGEPIPVKFFVIGDAGERCVINLIVREDGIDTFRTTSPVIRVEEFE